MEFGGLGFRGSGVTYRVTPSPFRLVYITDFEHKARYPKKE